MSVLFVQIEMAITLKTSSPEEYERMLVQVELARVLQAEAINKRRQRRAHGTLAEYRADEEEDENEFDF